MKMKVFSVIGLIIWAMICWLFSVFLWGFQGTLYSIARWISLLIVSLLFGASWVWAGRKMSPKGWFLVGVLLLLGLFLPASTFTRIFPASGPEPLASPEAITLISIISLALIVTALLLYSGLIFYKERQNAAAVGVGGTRALRRSAIWMGVALVLGAKALQNFYWFMVWDTTVDSLGILWLFFPFIATIYLGVILYILLPSRHKWTGFGYSLLIVALLLTVYSRLQRVDFHQLTEERAGQVSQAIESYYAREGRYPQDLRKLFPRDALSLPGPVIIYGQGWCYDGGDGYYRLGYVYRDNWSDPRLIGRIYKTGGAVPDLPPMCAQEVAALQTRFR
jgi:hypothetical protein